MIDWARNWERRRPAGSYAFCFENSKLWRNKLLIAGLLGGLCFVLVPELAAQEHEAAASAVQPEALPAGKVGAVLRWGEKVEAPPAVELRFQPSTEGDSEQPSGTVTCPLKAQRLLCKLPVGTFDLRFLAQSFAPIHAWSIEILPRQITELGRLRLTPGGSIIGWVEAPHRGFDFAAVELELVPVRAAATAGDTWKRMPRLARNTPVDRQGFFQLVGLKPGRYVLWARHPGYAPTRIDDLSVRASEELELDPFALSEGASLSVEVAPATNPFSKPWTLRLTGFSAEAGRAEKVAETSLDTEGRWQIDGLTPGAYQIQIGDEQGGRWRVDELELFPGDNFQRLTIPYVRLEGRLLLDDQPVVGASVRIEQHRGNTRISVKSREEGKFYAFLLRDAEWNIKVSHATEGIEAFFGRVRVPEKRKGQRWATKDFEIPNTRLFGEVVSSEGDPVADPVSLDLHSGSHGSHVQKLLETQTFEIRGLPEGETFLQARYDPSRTDRQGSSAPTTIELHEDSASGPVRLVVEDSHALAGLVVAPSGEGVVGAQVVALPEPVGAKLSFARIPTAVSDVEGVFEVSVPAHTRSVQLTIFPPGFAVTQQRVSLPTSAEDSENRPIIVPVEAEGGTLTVTFDGLDDDWRPELRSHVSLWAPMGIYASQLFQWAGLHAVASPDDRMVLPMLRPGSYMVCFGRESSLLVGGPEPPGAELVKRACAEGHLAPGGSLELRIPAEATAASSSRL